jgi:hypothetical protein
MKFKTSVFLSTLLLTSGMQASTDSFFPVIPSAQSPSPSPNASNPNSPGHSSQSSVPALPLMELSGSRRVSEDAVSPQAKNPHENSSTSEKKQLLLETAKEQEVQARKVAMQDPRQAALLYKQAQKIYQYLVSHTADEKSREACLRKSENCFKKMQLCLESVSQDSQTTTDSKSTPTALPTIQTIQDAQQIMTKAARSVEEANKITKQRTPFFPPQGYNIATPESVNLKAQAVALYKQAGDVFASTGKPNYAALCYQNSADQSCHAREKIELLRLSSQQHAIANNPAQAQAMEKAAAAQEKSLAAHRAKMAERKAARDQQLPEIASESDSA